MVAPARRQGLLLPIFLYTGSRNCLYHVWVSILVVCKYVVDFSQFLIRTSCWALVNRHKQSTSMLCKLLNGSDTINQTGRWRPFIIWMERNRQLWSRTSCHQQCKQRAIKQARVFWKFRNICKANSTKWTIRYTYCNKYLSLLEFMTAAFFLFCANLQPSLFSSPGKLIHIQVFLVSGIL
jgi:hypothetical protein